MKRFSLLRWKLFKYFRCWSLWIGKNVECKSFCDAWPWSMFSEMKKWLHLGGKNENLEGVKFFWIFLCCFVPSNYIFFALKVESFLMIMHVSTFTWDYWNISRRSLTYVKYWDLFLYSSKVYYNLINSFITKDPRIYSMFMRNT